MSNSAPVSLVSQPASRVSRSLAMFLLGTAIALPFVLALAVRDPVSHDEQQHVAAGILSAREGLSPYGDYPYFHLPYLIYVYRALFAFSDYSLLTARLFSAACAAATAGVIFAAPWFIAGEGGKRRRWAIGIAGTVLLLSAPVFFRTVGHAWNQEPSLLLALLSFICCYLATVEPGRAWLAAAGGLFLGAAIGFRVTWAPCVLLFGMWAGLGQPSWAARWKTSLLFCAGLGLALIPAACAFWRHPAGFVFGNVEFPRVNIVYRMATGEPRTMTLAKKLRFLVKSVLVPNWVLATAVSLSVLAVLTQGRALSSASGRLLVFLLLSVPFLLVGALAPSPLFPQYFYPLGPFLALAGIVAACEIPADGRFRILHAAISGGLVVIAASMAIRSYDLKELFSTDKWVPVMWHREAAQLRKMGPAGRMLTLAPAFALEGGWRIYPELSTGPFAWRVAPFVDVDRRPALRLLAPKDLELRMAQDPPAAILLHCEPRWEEPIEEYARRHGFVPAASLANRQLWSPPATR